MDLKQRLLQSEIQHLGQIIQTLSCELIVLQDFLTEEFGAKFEAYRSKHGAENGTIQVAPARPGPGRPKGSGKAKDNNQGANTGSPSKIELDAAATSGETEADFSTGETFGEYLSSDDPLGFPESEMDIEYGVSRENDPEEVSAEVNLFRQPIDAKEPMRKGGRKKTKIWMFYDKIVLDNGKISARCHICKGFVSSRATRMIDHRLKCGKEVGMGPFKREQKLASPRSFAKEIRTEVRRIRIAEISQQRQSEGESKSDEGGENKNDEANSSTNNVPKKHGRSLDVIWKYFDEVVTETGLRKAKCLACGELISPKAGRLRHHKIACEEVGPSETVGSNEDSSGGVGLGSNISQHSAAATERYT